MQKHTNASFLAATAKRAQNMQPHTLRPLALTESYFQALDLALKSSKGFDDLLEQAGKLYKATPPRNVQEMVKTVGAAKLALNNVAVQFWRQPDRVTWRALHVAIASLKISREAALERVGVRLISQTADLPENPGRDPRYVSPGALDWQTKPKMGIPPHAVALSAQRVSEDDLCNPYFRTLGECEQVWRRAAHG
jgi:hypothetical protein